jgi:prepilin-type N-terminal cleavage/methylation domain-containing protein
MKNKLRILKTEKGMTFVEIMLAVAILAIIAVPLLSTVIASVRNNATAKEKTEAIALAEMAMDEIKAQSVHALTTPPAIGISTEKLVSYDMD